MSLYIITVKYLSILENRVYILEFYEGPLLLTINSLDFFKKWFLLFPLQKSFFKPISFSKIKGTPYSWGFHRLNLSTFYIFIKSGKINFNLNLHDYN